MTIRLRRDTSANWTSTNPVLGNGQPGYDTTSKVLKIGDGATAWNSLTGISGAAVSDGDKGDITVTASGATWTIDNNAVTYAKMQDVSAADKLLGRGNGGGAGDTQEITLGTNLSMSGTTLNATGGGGVSDGDKGDITVTASGATWTIDNSAVTLAKQADVATARIMGRTTAGTGVQEALTVAQTKTLLAITSTDLSDFSTAVAATASVTANTAKVTNATHTGEVTGSGALTITAGAVTLAKMANFAANSIMGNNTGSAATPIALTTAQTKSLLAIVSTDLSDFSTAVAATAAVTANTAKVTNATHTGEVTGATALTIAADAVTNAKLANVATATIKGRVTAATGDPEDLTGTQATTLLDTFTSALKGLAPASGGGTTNFLRADGTWAAAGGGSAITVQDEGSNITTALATMNFVGAGVTVTGGTTATVTIAGGASVPDGDKGEITVASSGTVWTVDDDVKYGFAVAAAQNVTLF